jgi:hypothetical protein
VSDAVGPLTDAQIKALHDTIKCYERDGNGCDYFYEHGDCEHTDLKFARELLAQERRRTLEEVRQCFLMPAAKWPISGRSPFPEWLNERIREAGE